MILLMPDSDLVLTNLIENGFHKRLQISITVVAYDTISVKSIGSYLTVLESFLRYSSPSSKESFSFVTNKLYIES